MLRIKMHSFYNFWPDLVPKEGEHFINCYNDRFCKLHPIEAPAFAFLSEPRSIEPLGFEFVEKHPEVFSYIFTHDSRILKFKNAHFLNWAVAWSFSDIEKTRDFSIIASNKRLCPLHEERRRLAFLFESWPEVDTFGNYRNESQPWATTEETHANYRFAIAIENHIDEFWFTEKIVNCFANKTIPIYTGAGRIGDFFNADGIIECEPWQIPGKVREIIAQGTADFYESKREAIEENYETAKLYKEDWRKRFIKNYGHILEEMMPG